MPGAGIRSRRAPSPGAAALLAALALACGGADRAMAQAPAEPPTAATAPTPSPSGAAVVDPASPRASVEGYLRACREGRWAEAATYLEPAQAPAPATGPGGRERVLARRLKAVLDRHLWIDPAAISGEPAGNLADGLPPDVEELGVVPGEGGRPEAVRLAAPHAGGASRWLFSAATVGRVDTWYRALGESLFLDWIPEPLLRTGPLQLLWWQWLALPLVALAAWLLGRAASYATRAVLGRMAARTDPVWDEALVKRLGGPLTIAWAVAAARFLVVPLHLYSPALATVSRFLEAAFLAAFFWALWRSVDVARDLVGESPWARARATSRTLVPLGARSAKAVVLVIGAVTVVSELGYPVGSLIAGLGVGGLAVALAAQKTVENLFGAFSLGVDQPFREGDLVKVGDVQGHVEAIGLRSTRIRTLDRTVVSIPNGKLGDMSIETLAARDRMRLFCVLGLAHGTPAAKVEAAVAGIEGALRAHPGVIAEEVAVRLAAIAPASIDLEVVAWFRTTDGAEFTRFRQEALLGFLRAAEDAGVAWADRNQAPAAGSLP